MRPALLAALAGAALLAGCGGGDADSATGTPAAATVTDAVRIKDFLFVPADATVRAGRRIAVANGDAAPHTLTERPAGGRPLFDTGTLRGHRTGSFSADKPGTYAIFCAIHPFMKGTITVVA